MIKLGLKNYFKSYRLFFIPIGALSLGIVVGLSVMIPMLWSAVKGFVMGVAEAVGNVSYHWDEVKDAVLSSIEKLSWSNPQAFVDEVANAGYWQELLRDCASVALGDLSKVEAEMEVLAKTAMTTIAGGVMIFVLCTAIGAYVGYFVTRSMIRTGVAKRSFLKSILAGLLSTVINLTIIAAGLVLIAKSENYAILSILLTILVYGAAAFLEAYFVQGFKKVPFKKVMQIKNFFLLAILNVIEIAILLGVVALLQALTNPAIAIYAGFSVMIITISCLQLNAEAYVKSLADNPETEKLGAEHLAAAYQGLAPVTFADRKGFTAKSELAAPLLAQETATVAAAESPAETPAEVAEEVAADTVQQGQEDKE